MTEQRTRKPILSIRTRPGKPTDYGGKTVDVEHVLLATASRPGHPLKKVED